MMNVRRYLATISSKCRRRITMDATSIRHGSSQEHPTAAVIVIGNEILKAQVKDSNSFYACNLLYNLGIKVQKVSIVRDDLKDIAKEVRSFSKTFDYVFTSGGIGPTHDDVTYEAVALAFNDTLHYHPTLVDVVKNTFGYGDFPSPSYKMAYIPTKSTFKYGTNKDTGQALPYPCVVVRNVHIFPGSPTFFEALFQALCKESFFGYESFAATEMYLNEREETFANILSAVAREFPNVSFGSYPERNRYYKVRVTIESENKNDTEAARKMFRDRVPKSAVVHYDRAPEVDCLAKYEKLPQSERRPIYESTFEKFLSYYQKPEEVSIYLDCSEESVVLIHLARVVNRKLWQSSKKKLHAICHKYDDLQSSTNRFVREISDRYDVELCSLGCDKTEIPRTLEHLIALKPELRTILFGKRSSGNERDVFKNLARFSDISGISAQVHFPLIDWTDDDVASFVRSFSLPCHTTETRAG